MKFKFLEHTADVKFKAFGKTIEDAFVNAGYALKETIVNDMKIKEKQKKKIKVDGIDKQSLLQQFLEEFLYLLDAEDFILSEIKSIKIKGNNNGKQNKFGLEAEIAGDKASDYNFTNGVKAVTYNEMEVKHTKQGWQVQVVLDV